MIEITDLSQVSEDIKKLNPDIFKGECSEGTAKKKKPSKYHNVHTILAGRTFASGKEAVRAGELALLLKAGEIFCLEFQVRFPLPGHGAYVADFVYLNKQLEPVIEDSKGVKTPMYKYKKKLFKERYGKEIKEV